MLSVLECSAGWPLPRLPLSRVGSPHQVCCGTVILAYRRAVETGIEPTDGLRPPPRSATLLAVSAVGALSALAGFSGSLTIEALRGRYPSPTLWAVTAFRACCRRF